MRAFLAVFLLLSACYRQVPVVKAPVESFEPPEPPEPPQPVYCYAGDLNGTDGEELGAKHRVPCPPQAKRD